MLFGGVTEKGAGRPSKSREVVTVQVGNHWEILNGGKFSTVAAAW